MIDALKKALADYEEYLHFEDVGYAIKITVVKFIKDKRKFDAINKILYTEYNARYTPFVKEPKTNAYYMIDKPKQITQSSKVATTKDAVIVGLRAMADEVSETLRRMATDLEKST
jgi:hypothetical protein